MAVRILQRITSRYADSISSSSGFHHFLSSCCRASWIASVRKADATFRELFQQTTHLISCILETEKCARLHSGILYSSLALLHNALLLLTSEWRDSTSSFDAHLISPWLFQLTHQSYNTEVRTLWSCYIVPTFLIKVEIIFFIDLDSLFDSHTACTGGFV